MVSMISGTKKKKQDARRACDRAAIRLPVFRSEHIFAALEPVALKAVVEQKQRKYDPEGRNERYMPVDQKPRTQCKRQQRVAFAGGKPGCGHQRGCKREEIQLRKPHPGKELEVLIGDDAQKYGQHQPGVNRRADNFSKYPKNGGDPGGVI